jgi:hypothetical protein
MFTRRTALTALPVVVVGTAVFAQKPTAPKPFDPNAIALAPAVPLIPALSAERASIILPAGTHNVSSNMTIKADVVLEPGAVIDVAAGKTITFLGDMRAPVGWIFKGLGTVDLNRSRAPVAYPEWWGAGRDDSSVDSLSALQACLKSHPHMQLGAADYFISSAWQINTQHRRIWGGGKNWTGPNKGTRIIVTSGAEDVMVVGPESPPRTVNDYLKNLDIRWLELARSEPPSQAVAGLRLRHVLDCRVEALSSAEHAIGFAFQAVVHSYVRDCMAFRSVAGSGPGNIFCGFHFDGRNDIGLAGGNASIFAIDCNASVGGNPALASSVGALLQGGFADTFLVRLETSGTYDGISVDGLSATLSKRLLKAGQANLHIQTPVVDGFTGTGIGIRNTGEFTVVDLSDPYCGAANGAVAALSFNDVKGMVSVSGGQAIGWLDGEAKGTAIGLSASATSGLTVSGFKILGFAAPVVLNGLKSFAIDVQVNNPLQKMSQTAIVLAECSNGSVSASVQGAAGAFQQGVYVKGKIANITADCTRIVDNVIKGGKANKVKVLGIKNATTLGGLTIIGL